MIGGRQWAIKKFLRGYAVTIVTSALLILILALLIWARLGDLYSVRDISKINPLITSGQNELVAARDANGLTKVVKEDDAVSQSGKTSNNTQKNSSDSSNSQNSQTSSGASSSDGGDTPVSNTGGTGGNGTSGGTGGGTGGSTQPQHAFMASINKIGQTETSPTLSVGSCKVTHTFYAVIDGQYAPGTVTYRWKRSDGVISPQRSVSFVAGETTKTVSADPWDTSGTSGSSVQYTMTFEILSPLARSQSLSFTHSCPLFGGL